MTTPVTPSQDQGSAFTFRSIFTGSVLSLCLACGAPYGNMVIRGSYMALDFSTPGALFLLFPLSGPPNLAAGPLHPHDPPPGVRIHPQAQPQDDRRNQAH